MFEFICGFLSAFFFSGFAIVETGIYSFSFVTSIEDASYIDPQA